MKSRTSPLPARTISSPGSTCGRCWGKCRHPPIRTITRPLLDGSRQHADSGTGGAGNRAEENQAAGIRTIRDRRFAEGHYQVCEIREGKRGGFRPKLLVGRSVGKTGSVHQLHIGATRVQYSLEDVP